MTQIFYTSLAIVKWKKRKFDLDIDVPCEDLDILKAQLYDLSNVPVENQKLMLKGKLVKVRFFNFKTLWKSQCVTKSPNKPTSHVVVQIVLKHVLKHVLKQYVLKHFLQICSLRKPLKYSLYSPKIFPFW